MKKRNIPERHAVAGHHLTRLLFLLITLFLSYCVAYAQPATSTIPVGISRPCGSAAGTADSVSYFTYNGTGTLSRLSACKPNLAAPGLTSSLMSITFNPADGYIYMIRARQVAGVYTSYVWRFLPGTCPVAALAVYQTYPNQFIAGLDFDATGSGYQIIFTGAAAPFGLALQKIDFATSTLGPIINIDLQGKKIYTQNGDLVITPNGQFLMVWDNKYFSLNYTDYNTATPLKATYVDTLPLAGTSKLVGLAYAQGKLVGSASKGNTAGCSYYDFNILTGGLSPLTASPVGIPLQYSADMTNITSGIGSAKDLVSATPVSAGVYDLVYDIRVENFGDYPISNLQLTDDLTTIHPSGASAISNVSLKWMDNPAGIVMDSTYDGKVNKNMLKSAPSQTLPNFPVSKNYFVIRLKFRLTGVVTGTTYLNNAKVTGTGYNSVSLKDSSTNGDHPDLNANSKPDDTGEAQSTPFSISIAAESPPCSSINTILYSQNFGGGASSTTTLPGTVVTQYAGGANPMAEETYLLTTNANNGNTSKYINIADHSGSANGYMLLVNADVQNYKVFEDVVNITCANLKYTFLLHAVNVINSTYSTFCGAFGGTKQPKLTFIIRNAVSNAIITSYSTDDITDTTWKPYGLKWVMPAGVTSVRLQVYNTGEGGCGNAIAIDDIRFGLCDPQPAVSATLPSAGCLGQNATIDAALSDTTGMSGFLQYQWQSFNSGWSNISGASSSTLTFSPFTAADAKQYRLIVAATGNLGNPACQYTSNNVLLAKKDSSFSPTSATSDKSFVCPGEPAQLTVNGGSLGANASWLWYQSSCNGTYQGTGSSITVYPLATTTYYVRAVGDCNSTLCAQIAMPQLCILGDESVSLKGSLQQQYTKLLLNFHTDKKIRYFEVERSINATDFMSIKTVAINDYADQRGYSVQDNISAIASSIVYYRVKVVTESGEIIYSKITTISLNENTFKVSLVPNPATTTAKVMYFMPAAAKVSIRLFNAQGQLIYYSNISSVAGNNIFQFNELDKLPAGVYDVSIITSATSNNIKFLIHR